MEECGANLSRAYRVNLNVLALVALFTGGFLVFSTQSLEVARRRARARAAARAGTAAARRAAAGARRGGGGRRRWERRSASRLATRIARAALRVRRRGPRRGHVSRRSRRSRRFRSSTALLYLARRACSIALAGALLPALDAARAPPAQALKAGDEQRMLARVVTVLPGLVLLVAARRAGAGQPRRTGFRLRATRRSPACSSAAILLMPWLSRLVFERLPASAMRRTPLALALAQLRGAPGQAMVSLAAIVASFSLMVGDGDHGRLVSRVGRPLARRGAARRPLLPHQRSAGETAWLDPSSRRACARLPQRRARRVPAQRSASCSIRCGPRCR